MVYRIMLFQKNLGGRGYVSRPYKKIENGYITVNSDGNTKYSSMKKKHTRYHVLDRSKSTMSWSICDGRLGSGASFSSRSSLPGWARTSSGWPDNVRCLG